MGADRGGDRAAPSPSRSDWRAGRGAGRGRRGPPRPPASPGARLATRPSVPPRAGPAGPPAPHTCGRPAAPRPAPTRLRRRREQLSGRSPTAAARHFRPPGAPTASIRRVVERRVFDEPPSERAAGGGGAEGAGEGEGSRLRLAGCAVRSSHPCPQIPNRKRRRTRGAFVVGSALAQDAMTPPEARRGQVTHKSHRAMQVTEENARLQPGNPAG